MERGARSQQPSSADPARFGDVEAREADFTAGEDACSTLLDESRVLPEVLMMNEPGSTR